MLLIVSVPGPLLVRVTACDALVAPTFWLPNVRELALKDAEGDCVPPPPPLSVTVPNSLVRLPAGTVSTAPSEKLTVIVDVPVLKAAWVRSEERRVGKECRCWWGSDD